MSLTVLLAFFGACILLAVTPGPMMSLIIANATRYGSRAGLLTVLGNITGLAILLSAVIFGLSSIMVFMSDWFEVLRWVGAAYLIYLGVRALSRLRGGAALPAVAEADAKSSRWFWQALLVALSNPKVLLFLGAFLPQFVDPAQPAFMQLIVLAVVFLVTLGGIDALYAVAVAQARTALNSRWRTAMEGTTGALLIAGGLWIATARR